MQVERKTTRLMGNWNSRSKRRKLRKKSTGKIRRRQKNWRKCNERWKKRKMKCNEATNFMTGFQSEVVYPCASSHVTYVMQ